MADQALGNPCPICSTPNAARLPTPVGRRFSYTCARCGDFVLTDTADRVIRENNPGGRAAANASAWLREHQGTELFEEDLNDLWKAKVPSVAERAMRVLQEIAKLWPAIGQSFDFRFSVPPEPSWLAVSWSLDFDEFAYLLIEYLHKEIGALSGSGAWQPSAPALLTNARITPKGHALLENLKASNPESPIGFCAMWFADELRPLWTNAIEPAIRRAGYDAKRIDQHEHVNRIDDEIVAMIRRSRFVVADFTGQRGSVYFEAGYALALGLRVIWLCREDELASVQFDTRQYNFLRWKPTDYADLAKRLQNRIEATLGRGPIRS